MRRFRVAEGNRGVLQVFLKGRFVEARSAFNGLALIVFHAFTSELVC